MQQEKISEALARAIDQRARRLFESVVVNLLDGVFRGAGFD